MSQTMEQPQTGLLAPRTGAIPRPHRAATTPQYSGLNLGDAPNRH